MPLKNLSPNFSHKSFNHRHHKITPRQILLWISLSLIGLFLFGVLSMGITVAVLSVGLPDVHKLNLLVPQSTTIYDREGKVLFVKHGGENRQYVEYDKISPHLIDATVAIEDSQYWEHPGFNAKGILRAVLNEIFHLTEEQQGGSTITQQYVKKAILTSEKTLTRKLKEIILSVQLEQNYDKKKILELYLNKIPYGNNAYGIEKAAQIYFDKSAKELDLAESVILAALPNAPTYYDPYRKHRYSTLAKQFTPEEIASRTLKTEGDLEYDEFLRGLIGKTVQIDATHSIYIRGRTDLILNRMLLLQYITEKQRAETLTKIQNIQFNDYHESIEAPHFVFYILDQLEEKYSKETIEQGGLQVYTSLDPKLQEIAEKVLKEGGDYNAKKFNTKNASLVAMDPKNGHILTMVGSKDYFDKSIDGNENVALDYRQPGSSFKPFIYAQAFYNQIAPASVVFDTPIQIGTKSPKNYDGKFTGPIPIRKALGQSQNIPAIKAYFVAGEKSILELVQKMGIHLEDLKKDPDFVYGYNLALGGGRVGVRLLDMTSAFSVFAANGVHRDPVSILKVTNSKGDVLEEWKETKGEQVLDPQIAYLITSILSDTTVRLGPQLTVPNQINAAKTGTSDRQDPKTGIYYPHDMWTMGYTTKLVAGIWTGNNNDRRDGYPTATATTDGLYVAAPMWKEFMTQALKGSPAEEFPIPSGIKQVAIASASGKLPGPTTPPDQIKTEIFASFSIPTEIDNSYAQIDIDTLCNKLANEYTPEAMKKKVTFINQPDLADKPEWQAGVEAYLKSHSGESQNPNDSLVTGTPPTESCPERTAQNYSQRPTITITTPTTGSAVSAGSRLKVEVDVNANGQEITKVEFFLDDKFKYSTIISPYVGEVRLPVGEEKGVHHTLTAKVHDKLGFVGETTIDVVTGD